MTRVPLNQNRFLNECFHCEQNYKETKATNEPITLEYLVTLKLSNLIGSHMTSCNQLQRVVFQQSLFMLRYNFFVTSAPGANSIKKFFSLNLCCTQFKALLLAAHFFNQSEHLKPTYNSLGLAAIPLKTNNVRAHSDHN